MPVARPAQPRDWYDVVYNDNDSGFGTGYGTDSVYGGVYDSVYDGVYDGETDFATTTGNDSSGAPGGIPASIETILFVTVGSLIMSALGWLACWLALVCLRARRRRRQRREWLAAGRWPPGVVPLGALLTASALDVEAAGGGVVMARSAAASSRTQRPRASQTSGSAPKDAARDAVVTVVVAHPDDQVSLGQVSLGQAALTN